MHKWTYYYKATELGWWVTAIRIDMKINGIEWRGRCNYGRIVIEIQWCCLWRWKKGTMNNECGQPLEAGPGKEMDSS